jgi:hypothetical protein
MVKRFIPGTFRCNPAYCGTIISKTVKRYLDKLEIPLYYNDIFISRV